MLKRLAMALGLLALAACTNANDLDEPRAELGDFSLSIRAVVAPNLTKGPLSREASKEEWEAALLKAISERFDRYEGDKLYHFGISVDGYVLAQPGIPLVLSPKSVLIFNLTVWDDATQTKLNPKPEQITVFESLSGETVLGSGLTQSREKQLENLTRNAAKLIENYLIRMRKEKGWFGPVPAVAPLAAPAVATETAKDATADEG